MDVRVLRYGTLRDFLVAVAHYYGRVDPIFKGLSLRLCDFLVLLRQGRSLSLEDRAKGHRQAIPQIFRSFMFLLRVFYRVLRVGSRDRTGARVVAYSYVEFLVYVAFGDRFFPKYSSYSPRG